MTHTISILVENEFGVLARVSAMFSGRGFNIESLSVAPTLDPTVSRITLITTGDDRVVGQIVGQLNKLIPVIRVADFKDTANVERELVLVKVRADAATRGELMNVIDIFRGRVIDMGSESYIIEITGGQGKIDAILDLLRPLGILEIVRTGRVAMFRGIQTLRTSEGEENVA